MAMNQTDPNFNAVLTQVQALLICVGTVMAKAGFENTSSYKWVMLGSGSIVAVGSALWGVYNALVNLRRARAVGVQASLNMVQAGKALTSDGQIVTQIGPDTTPFKPATLQTSDQIVADFGPKASAIAKS
jgi:hypothetical protein